VKLGKPVIANNVKRGQTLQAEAEAALAWRSRLRVEGTDPGQGEYYEAKAEAKTLALRPECWPRGQTGQFAITLVGYCVVLVYCSVRR